MKVEKFKKKPITINAIQFLGKLTEEIENFVKKAIVIHNLDDKNNAIISIRTLEGTSYSLIYGDWIIQGINGEFYPCKDDIFKKTYSEVDSLKNDDNEYCLKDVKKLLSLIDERISKKQIEFLEVPIRDFTDKWAEVLEDL